MPGSILAKTIGLIPILGKKFKSWKNFGVPSLGF